MAKTSYQLIPAEFDLSYKKALQSGDRFQFTRVRRKTLFISRNRKKGLTQKSLIPILSPVWQGLTQGERDAWNSAGVVANMSGFKLFVRDRSLRIANDIEGYATPNDLYQTAVGTLIVSAPATSLKIEQLHPLEYWVQRKVRGTRSQYEPIKIIESFALPLSIAINYKADLVAVSGGDITQTLITSYDNTHQAFSEPLDQYETLKVGQSFTGTDILLSSVKFNLRKHNSPTGYAVAKLYSHTGTYDVNGKPSTLLATSDNFDVSTLSMSYALHTLNFSGANQYQLVAGTYYFITFEYSGGGGGSYVEIGEGDSATLPSGNYASLYSGDTVWYTQTTVSIIFYLYGILAEDLPVVKARFYCICYSHYQGLTFENIVEIPFTLQQDWIHAEATLGPIIGKDRGYTAFIEIENARGTLYFDNIEINHSGQNWCRDPHTIDIDQSFTKAFYQIPKHWAPVDISDGAFYGSLYYNV